MFSFDFLSSEAASIFELLVDCRIAYTISNLDSFTS